MDTKLIDSFTDSINNVVGQFTGQQYQKDNIKEYNGPSYIDVEELFIDVGFSGDYSGKFILSMEEGTAKDVASGMMRGMPIDTLDAMSFSALSECGNMVSGNCCVLLSNEGTNIDITPPTINKGEHNQVFFNHKAVEVQLKDAKQNIIKLHILLG